MHFFCLTTPLTIHFNRSKVQGNKYFKENYYAKALLNLTKFNEGTISASSNVSCLTRCYFLYLV